MVVSNKCHSMWSVSQSQRYHRYGIIQYTFIDLSVIIYKWTRVTDERKCWSFYNHTSTLYHSNHGNVTACLLFRHDWECDTSKIGAVKIESKRLKISWMEESSIHVFRMCNIHCQGQTLHEFLLSRVLSISSSWLAESFNGRFGVLNLKMGMKVMHLYCAGMFVKVGCLLFPL